MAINNGITQSFKPGDIGKPTKKVTSQGVTRADSPVPVGPVPGATKSNVMSNINTKQVQGQKNQTTLGGGQVGGNFFIGNNDTQGQLNSLVGTGAMAGINTAPTIIKKKSNVEPLELYEKKPREGGEYDYGMSQWNGSFNTNTQPQNTGTTVVNNTKKATGGAKATNTQQQTSQEPEGFWENGVWYRDAADRADKTGGIEFGYGNYAKKEETPQEQEQTQQDDKAGEQAVSQMESDLAPESGMIYGRATGDSSNPSGGIQTNTDEYSASYLANQGRVSNMNALQSMDSQSIAASIISGTTPYGSQAMRDLQQYNPGKYEEIQNAIKQLKGQNVVNGIASGNLDYTTGMNGQSNIANDKTDFALSNSNGVSSVGDILKNVNETLASNQVASTAQEQMGTIENDMINLQNRLKNLQDEARKVFKGDVPAYIIQAYVSNRTAEIQDQLSVLDQRYNAAYNRYQQEREQTKWNAEMDLKKQELEMKKQSLALDEWSTRQGVELNWAKLNSSLTAGGTSTTVTGNTVQTTSLSRSEISSVVDNLVTQCQNGQLGNAQCAAGIQKNYLPYLGVDLGTLSAYSKKQGICNEDTSYIPQKGDLVVMSSSTQPQYGHIGMVIGVDGTTLTYLDWNGTVKDGVGTEKAAVRTTTLSNGKIYGYYNPTKTESSYYDPSYADIYGKYLTGKFAAGKQLQTQANAMGLTVQQLDAQAKAWKADQKNDNQATERLNAIQNLIGSTLNRAKRISATTNVGQLLSGELSNWNADYKFVKDNITFDKLLELKNNGATFGALSDNELRSIGNAASKLNANMSDAEFKKTLVGIYNDLRRGLGEAPMSESEIIAAFNGSKNGSNGFSSAASGGYGIEKNANNLYNM